MRSILLIAYLFQYFAAISQSLAPADIHPNAVVLDVDKIEPFYDGRAVVQKGESQALINRSGKYAIPFNKFLFFNHFKNYIIPAFNVITKQHMLIDTNGVVIHIYLENPRDPFNSDRQSPYRWTDDGYALASEYKQVANKGGYNDLYKQITVWTNKGIKATYRSDVNNYSLQDNLGTFSDYSLKETKQGYCDNKKNTIISAQFDRAEAFSEGMAAVAKYNEFKEIKWGFINKAGKLVIPFKYTNKPGQFKNGLALINPVDKTEFEYCYIDKTGNIKIKCGEFEGHRLFLYTGSDALKGDVVDGLGEFQNGFARWPWDIIVDTNGNFKREAEFAIDYGLTELEENFRLKDINQNQVLTSRPISLINLKTKTHVPPVFTELSNKDDVSGLIYARYTYKTDDEHNPWKTREGFIHEEGIFLIVKGEKGKW